MSVKDIDENGLYDLYDANDKIGKTNIDPIKTDYISIIKDGAGVGRIRILPKNSMFIGTMGALQSKNSELTFIYSLLTRFSLNKEFSGSTIPHIYFSDYGKKEYFFPKMKEQKVIGSFFQTLDNLITLHQRKFYKNIEKDFKMQRRHKLFVDYYENWIKLYKEGAVKKCNFKEILLNINMVEKIST